MIYKFAAPAPHALENLKNGVLFCRHYSDFNDPFEFWAQIISEVPEINSERARYIEATRTWGFPEGASPEYAEMTKEYFDSLTDGEPPFEQMFDHTRIACFASEPGNLLMWSHYADGLRGFCLGFDAERLTEADRDARLVPVEYLDKPPVADTFVYAVAEDQYDYHMGAIEDLDRGAAGGISEADRESFKQAADEAFALMDSIRRLAFASKPAAWKYENETRLLLFAPEGGKEPVFYGFPAEALREVVLGERMPPDYREQLEAVVRQRYPHATIRLAKRSVDSYEIALTEETAIASNAKRIAILGWGSLIWKSDGLRLDGDWQRGGPVLPIEFSRVSDNLRLTLVIDEKHGVDVPCSFALSAEADLNAAVEGLRGREGTPRNRIGYIDLESGECCVWAREQHPRAFDVIREWATQHGFAAVIWTALGTTFERRAGEPFSPEAAVRFLGRVSDEVRALALDYVRNAPEESRTPARREIERAFPVHQG